MTMIDFAVLFTGPTKADEIVVNAFLTVYAYFFGKRTSILYRYVLLKLINLFSSLLLVSK